MKKTITYQKKIIYLFILSGLFAIVLYQIAIVDTINLMIENSAFEAEISKNKDAPLQIKSLKHKAEKIKQLIGNNDYEGLDMHQELLISITEYIQKNGMVLKDFPQPYVISEKGYLTKTAKVTIEGDFVSVLKLIYFLEHNYHIGKVVSVDFKASKQLRTRKRKLNTTIYLQNVKTVNHEENT